MKNPVGTIFIMFTLALLGLIALRGLPISYWPDITPPFLVVQTPFLGAVPEDIEEEVTKPLERVASTVDEIYEIESSSTEGMSQLTVRFNWGTDITQAKTDMREKIDGARPLLPRDVGPTSILALDALLPAPLEIAVSSDRYDQGSIRKFLEDEIVVRLLRLSNVAAVDIRGGRAKIVRVSADPEKLLNLGIPLGAVSNALAIDNVNAPGGKMTQGTREFIIRTFNKYESLDDIRDVVVAQRGTIPVRVGDLANVLLVDDEQIGIARINGEQALALSIRQSAGGNTVALVDEVNYELERIRNDYPYMHFNTIKDDSDFIRKAIRSVSTNVVLGAILASIFIYLFLGSLRNTIIIALSVPVSIFATFLVMKTFGLTINTISLGGLALGVGMIVDASIVVLENIFYRLKLDGGESRIDRAILAVREVGLAISASVMTTVVVFLPLAFTRGLAFFLLGELALTVVAALLFSLLVALTLIPMLSFKIMSVHEPRLFLPRAWSRMIDWLSGVYRPIVNFAAGNARRAGITIIFACLLMAIPVFIFSKLDVDEMPPLDQGQFRVELELPRGTSLAATSGIAADMEKKLLGIERVRQVYSVVGLTAFYNRSSPHTAFIDIQVDTKDGRLSTEPVIKEARELLTGYPDARITARVLTVMEGMVSKTVDLQVLGPDLDTLRALSEALSDTLLSYPELTNVQNNLTAGKPELVIHVDRNKASEWGLSVSKIANTIRTAVDGVVVTHYSTREGVLYDVEVTLLRSKIRTLHDVRELPFQTPSGTVVPLRAVADFSITPGPANIRRSDQQRFFSVTADAAEGVAMRKARSVAKQVQSNFILPMDYTWREAGASRAVVESFQSLGIALLLAVFLVYVVMATQFNNVWQPLVIASAIPLSLFGAAFGLLVFGAGLNINSFLGMIMLSGIVVNNGILLIDYINRLRKKGVSRFRAIVEAGQRRMRPILMTSLTTISGMLFIALGLGEGTETLVPLSAVVIGGLASSTALTLLIVPAIYTLFDSFFNMFAGRKKEAAQTNLYAGS